MSTRYAAALALLLSGQAVAQTTVTSFAPPSNTTPGVWYESNITSAGDASIVDLTGTGGNLEGSQPLPVGAARLTTTTDNNDRANVGVFDAFGTPDDIFSSLSISYSYHKASNPGQNLFAAPSLKLTFFNTVCDDPGSAGDCFGLLVYEPTWNQPGFEGTSVAVPLDTWMTATIDENNGLFWWTGGFGQPNTAGGPPLRTLAQWKTVFTSDFGDADLAQIEIGVGSFNQNQIGYFDDVNISHAFGGGYSESYDFEAPVVANLDTGETFAAIQDAIDDADTLDGHTLEMLVPDHTTPELQIVFTKDLTLQGGSPDTLRPSQDTGTSGDARGWFLVPLGRVVTFRDLIFDGTGFKVWTGIRNHGTLTVTNCDFTHIQYEASGPSYSGVGIQHFDAGGALMTVTDCTFSDMGRIGIHVFEPAEITGCAYTGKGVGDFLDYFACVDSFGASVGVAEFCGCTVTSNRGVASVDGSGSAAVLVTTFFGPGTEATFTDCSFTDNTLGIAVGFDALDTSVVTANFNNIAGNDFGVVNTSPLIVVDAKENWWGDPAGPDDPAGTLPAINGLCVPVDMIFNLNPAGDSVTDENVCYCPWAETALGGPASGSLTLEIDDTCLSGRQIEVEVWMRDLTGPISGFQAFIEFDTGTLAYNGGASSYTGSPFPLHVQNIVTAEVAAGKIRIDGSDGFGEPGTLVDSHLATLVFDVLADCSVTSVDFDLAQPFDSELSVGGTPVPTTLVNTPGFTLDDTPPVIDPCPADIVQAADANVGDGCTSAVVTWTDPGAVDACTAVTVTCAPPSGSTFPLGVTVVTCTATDECGNTDECTFEVEVIATNVVELDVELVGVFADVTRCIHFVTDDCGSTADLELLFVDHDASSVTPVRFVGSIEVPCGNWTTLCAKDAQHTLWASTGLSATSAAYDADTILSLEPGDTDNDGDVDINDVTFFVATFGDLAVPGGCPFDGTRDGDFSNNGAVGSEDYSLMTGNWLEQTSCACALPEGIRKPGRRTSVPTSALAPWIAERTDLNSDGVVDALDVRIFEQRNGLPSTLSAAMQR